MLDISFAAGAIIARYSKARDHYSVKVTHYVADGSKEKSFPKDKKRDSDFSIKPATDGIITKV